MKEIVFFVIFVPLWFIFLALRERYSTLLFYMLDEATLLLIGGHEKGLRFGV